MNYLSSLQCKTEPFTSSSGAEIFVYQAAGDSITKLSRNILSGSGLQLIIGTAGSGKTTLLHQLSQKFSADNRTVVLLLNNPRFRDLEQFLITVAGVFKTVKAPAGFDDDTFQQAFNSFFFKLCQQENKTVLLLIDNGRNLPDFCLRALNSFYDHHPDCKRYLQTVLCGEPSFLRKIKGDKALNSKVAAVITPELFRFKDVRKLIHLHLERAAADPGSPPVFFSMPAQWVIYRLTQGHPQKIIDLCHFLILTLVIENRKKADWFMTLRSAKVLIPVRAKKLQIIRTTFLSSLVVFMLAFGLWPEQIRTLNLSQPDRELQVIVPQKVQTPAVQSVKPEEVAQKTSQPGQIDETSSPVPADAEKDLPPKMTAEEQGAGVLPAEKSAGLQDQPEKNGSTADVPGPEPAAAAAADEEAGFKPKPIQEDETIVTPTSSGKREVKQGDAFPGKMQQDYGHDSVKTQDMGRVTAANPNLRDLHNQEVGDQVFSPDIAQEEAESPAAATALKSQPGLESVPKPPPPADSSDHVDKQVEPPEYLGDIITGRGETFGDMVRSIYGPWSFNPENVKKVMAVNPDLKNPELLNVGDGIRFPTIPLSLTPAAEEVWWVRITAFDTIQSAYRFLRKHRKSLPPLVIIPSRDDSGQVRMNVLMEEYFKDEDSAQQAIDVLPPAVTPRVEALHGLDPAIFYYRVKQED